VYDTTLLIITRRREEEGPDEEGTHPRKGLTKLIYSGSNRFPPWYKYTNSHSSSWYLPDSIGAFLNSKVWNASSSVGRRISREE
jgi:hypothetical protein